MTLDELIAALEVMPQDRVLVRGFRHPHSYRGYYDQLAFEPAEDVLVATMLADAQSALGRTFTGYKGGEYVMHGWTGVWLARYGDTGEELTPSTLELWERLTDNSTGDVTYHSRDFRTYPPQRVMLRGIPFMLTKCEELVDGRWEGFITLRIAKPQPVADPPAHTCGPDRPPDRYEQLKAEGYCDNCWGDGHVATAGRPEGDGLETCTRCGGSGRLA